MKTCNCQGVECVNSHHTAYAVSCGDHGQVKLSNDEYMRQLKLPNNKWECPYCHQQAEWDDDHYEQIINQTSEASLYD